MNHITLSGLSRNPLWTKSTFIGGVAAALFIGCIVAANWMIGHVGTPSPFLGGPHTLPVGFGLSAPSGVYVVGLALVLRDSVQHNLGPKVTAWLILVGVVVTATFAPNLAFASAAAFLVSEGADFGTYSLVEKRWGHLSAVATSNAVSIVVDSLVFLSIAFGSLAFIHGQVVGKAWATLAGFAVIYVLQQRRQVVAA